MAIGIAGVTTSEDTRRRKRRVAHRRGTGAEAITSSAFGLSRLLSWPPSSSPLTSWSFCSVTGVAVQQAPSTPEAQRASHHHHQSQLRCQQQQCGCFHRYASASSDKDLTLSSPYFPLGIISFSLEELSRFFISLLKVLASLIAACVCVPFAFVSVTLTILCFYSRPRSLRIL